MSGVCRALWFSLQGYSQSIHHPSLYLCLVSLWPRCRTSHLDILNFVRFTQAHISRLFRSLCVASLPSSVATAPHSLVSSMNMLRQHSISLSMSPMKIKYQCWETPPITGLHLDIEPLTEVLWVRPSSQFLIYRVVSPSNPHLSSLEKRKLYETASNAFHKSR